MTKFTFEVRLPGGVMRQVTAFRRRPGSPWTIKTCIKGRQSWRSLGVNGDAKADLALVKHRAQLKMRELLFPETMPAAAIKDTRPVEIVVKSPNGKDAYSVLIDAADAALVGQYEWHAKLNRKSGLVYVVTQSATAPGRRRQKSKSVFMHRMLCPAPEHLDVDHRNGCTLDMRRHNLRPATRAQNLRNRVFKIHSTAGTARGVSKVGENRFRATLTLGTFNSATDAAHAYQRALLLLADWFMDLSFATRKPATGGSVGGI